jgi:hypothetical protein
MAGEADTKVCPQCAETIRAKAKLCPYCRTRQNRFVHSQNEIILAVIVLSYVTLFAVVCALVGPWAASGRNFGPHRDDLQVVRTRMERISNSMYFSLTGYVTNRGKFAWRVEEYEVRFVDADRRLKDADYPDNFDSFVVQPKQEHAFRLKLYEVAYTNSDISEMVRVTKASDGNHKKWWN